jgi:RNA polymerase sigma factor (sigma-70 family)
MGENRIVEQLRGVAARLTRDSEMQKDLLQEMFIHLIQVQGEQPNHTLSWYVKSCEFHARNNLMHGRSVDSLKRARNCIPLGQWDDDPHRDFYSPLETMDPVDLHSELFTKDLVDLIMPRLTDKQQQIFCLLMKGFRVREIARELCITHPAVVKHRKKIARIANEFLGDRIALAVASSSANGSNGDRHAPLKL